MEARSYASGTVINALASGIGSAFALELETRVRLKIENDLKESVLLVNGVERDASLIKNLIEERVVVEVRTEIPEGCGLGSSSAFMNALIAAYFKSKNLDLDAREILVKNARISLRSGISYTGAFDDAAASLLGGLVVSDNRIMKLKLWRKIKGDAIVLLPSWKREEISLARIRESTTLIEQALRDVMEGDFCSAMLRNSIHYCNAIGYPLAPVEESLEIGVCGGLSGNGPAYTAFGDSVGELQNAWSEFGEIIKTRIATKPAENVKIPDTLFE